MCTLNGVVCIAIVCICKHLFFVSCIHFLCSNLAMIKFSFLRARISHVVKRIIALLNYPFSFSSKSVI